MRIRFRNGCVLTAEVQAPPWTGMSTAWTSGYPEFRLSGLRVTRDEAMQIMSGRMGEVRVDCDNHGCLTIGTRLTEQEASRIADGADPVEVLTGCRRRPPRVYLVMVPEIL